MQQTLDFAISDQFTFDPKTGRYRYRSGTAGAGQFAPRTAILALTQSTILSERKNLLEVGLKLADGKITLRQFQSEAAEVVRRLHVANAVLGRGGIDKMTDRDWLEVARTLKTQYYAGSDPETGRKFGLKHLAEDIKAGKLSAGQLQARLSMYALASKQSYWRAFKKTEAESGREYAIRQLGKAEHCAECIQFASLPPQPMDSIVLPGQQCSCRANCQCSILSLTLTEAVKRGMAGKAS